MFFVFTVVDFFLLLKLKNKEKWNEYYSEGKRERKRGGKGTTKDSVIVYGVAAR